MLSQNGATNAGSQCRGLRCESVKTAAQSRIRKELVACPKIRFVGLDVHTDTIAVAVAEPDGEVRSLGTIPNRLESVRKLVVKLGPAKELKACYEAGPTGYVLYWQLTALGVVCEVVAPGSGAGEAWRPGEDRSPGRHEIGAQLSRRRPDAGVGSR